MQLKCLIVEDEMLAQEVLKKYISALPSLHLVHSCNSSFEALFYLHSNKIDLIFLDINLPEMNGLDFLKSLSNPPHVILTTAYSEYALEGYEYAVCDYLLKPIRFERFVKAVNKVVDLEKRRAEEQPNASVDIENKFILLKEESTVHKIPVQNIVFVRAFGNYLKTFTTEGKVIVARITLTEIETQLPDTLFLRIHKSYIVATRWIKGLKQNKVQIQDKILPLGATYKQEVLKKVRGQINRLE